MSKITKVLGWSGLTPIVTVIAVLLATPTESPTQPSPQQTFPDVSQLKIAETWKFEYDVETDGGFVPDIAAYSGKLFMYLAFQGDIISFSSIDGKTETLPV